MNYFELPLKYRYLFKKVAIGVLALLGGSFVFLTTNSYGAGLTPDSVAYISASRNLAEGNGFLTYNGLYLVVQPPLYPIILAVVKKITLIDPLTSAGYVNAVLFGVIIYLSGLLLLKYLKSFALIFLGTVSVLISYALVHASLMALSELLFIFLVLLFFYFLGTYQKKGDLVSLFLFSVSVALSCLTRYTGVVLILAGLISILVLSKNNAKEKFWHSLIFLVVAVSPIIVWITRNYFISGTLVGQRAASSYTLFENTKFLFSTVSSWYIPSNLLGIYFLLILLIIAGRFFIGFDRSKSSLTELLKQIGPTLLFVSLYVGVIVVSSTTTAYDRISDRLLSPIYIPIIFILFFVSDKIRSHLIKYYQPKLITGFLIIGILIWIVLPITNTIRTVHEYARSAGLGYNSFLWRESPTIGYIKLHEHLSKNYAFYSNEPEAVYILTGIQTKRSPAKTYYNSPQLFNINHHKEEIWHNGEKVYLIWFDLANRSFLFTIDELREKINMTVVAQMKDGEIYTFH
ncbi:MAG: hypothetical protein ACYC6D_03580 [Melioribacteraceae bacterium]